MALGLSACAERDAAEAGAPPAAAAAAPEAQRADLAGESHPGSPIVAERKLIQTAELHIEVESYEEARRALDKHLARLGGYVESARVEHHDGAVSYAELTLRMPAEKLTELMSDSAGYGKVLREHIQAEDVSDSYYDLTARLKNARRLEARLLELMANKTDSVQHLLEVERELARVREQIERFDGQLARMDEQVSLSTVKLRLDTRRVYAAGAEPTLGERVSRTLGSSYTLLETTGYALLLFAVALVPWLLPLLAIGFGLRALVRRRRARRALGAPTPATSAPA